jgi:hypothetical protein
VLVPAETGLSSLKLLMGKDGETNASSMSAAPKNAPKG